MSFHVAYEESSHQRRVWRTTVERVMALWLLFVKIPKDVQPNLVPTLVVTGNVPLRGRVKCVFWFLAVKKTRSVIDGDVWVRPGFFHGTSLFGVGFDSSEFNSIDVSSGSDIFTSPWFS